MYARAVGRAAGGRRRVSWRVLGAGGCCNAAAWLGEGARQVAQKRLARDAGAATDTGDSGKGIGAMLRLRVVASRAAATAAAAGERAKKPWAPQRMICL